MITFLVVVIVLIGAASLVGTLYAGKQVNKTIKTLDEASPDEQEALLKANYYKSAKTNVSLMVIIYVLLILAFAVGLGLYIYFR
ncbi:MAG: hypothetical protein ACO1OC_04615 [Tuberibacillus sp.]